MDYELELRHCDKQDCTATFSVLPSDPMRYCSIIHMDIDKNTSPHAKTKRHYATTAVHAKHLKEEKTKRSSRKPVISKIGEVFGDMIVVDRGKNMELGAGDVRVSWKCKCTTCGHIEEIIARNLVRSSDKRKCSNCLSLKENRLKAYPKRDIKHKHECSNQEEYAILLARESLSSSDELQSVETVFKDEKHTIKGVWARLVVVELATKEPLNSITAIFKGIPDSHVVLGTIQPKKLYTGERG